MLKLCFFFFNDTATTEIYTLSLHDALPICLTLRGDLHRAVGGLHRRGPVREHLCDETGAAHGRGQRGRADLELRDRKSTRLNSSHGYISYAVFCLKKKQSTIPPIEVLDSLH